MITLAETASYTTPFVLFAIMVMQKSKSFIPTVAKKFTLNKYVVIPKLFLHCNLFCKLTVECGNIAKFNAEISAKSGI